MNDPMRPDAEASSGPETGLSLLCVTIMEAAWLSCLVVTPLLFDVHSNSVFEVDKAAVVRSLALVIGVAGLVRMSERRTSQPGCRARASGASFALRRLRSWMVGHPWVIVTLLYLCAHALATLASVAPRLSLWGSFARAQGLYTTAAYLAVFIAVLTFCRARPQIERIVQACLLTSLPVSLYGIVQRFGSDPIPWRGDVSVRVGSTLGNPIFLGAFLIMVVPLTIYRHVEVGKRVTEGQTAFVKSMFIGGGVLNVLLQVISWSRGPVSGSLAALVTLGLWSVQGRVLGKPLRCFVRIGAYSVLLSAQLAAIVLSGSRGPSLALLAGLSVFAILWASTRGKGKWLAATLALGAALGLVLVWLNLSGSPLDRDHRSSVSRFAHLLEGTGRVRLLIWEGVMDLLPDDPARWVLGHGPESGQLVMPPHVPPGLGRVERALPDRSHNETLDVVVTTGLLGLAVYLLLFTGTLVRGLRWAGAAATPAQRRLGAAMCLSAAAGAVLAARFFDGSWRLSGVALPAGMLVGMGFFLGGHVVSRRASRRAALPRWSNRRTLAVLVFSALVAHFVEIQVGIAITATRLYFWVLLALMVGVLARLRRPTTCRAEGWIWGRVPASHVAAGLMVTLSVATLVSSFVAAREAASITVMWIVGVTWVVGGILLFTETIGESPGPGLRRSLIVYGGLPFLGISLIVVLHLASSRLVNDPTLTPVPFYTALFLLLGTLAISLRPQGPGPPVLMGSRHGAAVALGLAIVTIALILAIDLDVVRADISLKQAQVFASRPGGMDRAVSWARRAVAIQPSRDHLHNLLGQLEQRKAEKSADSDQRRKLFEQAEESFLTAYEISPLLAENALNLARLYRSWSEHSRDEEARRSLYGRALTYYRSALARYPTSVRAWNELATTYGLMGEPDEAEAAFARSLALDDTFAGTYVDRGRLNLAQENPGQALEAFRRAIIQDGRSVEAFRGLALANAQLGRPAEAARAYRDLLALRPADLDAHLQLARLYSRLGRPDLASAHARSALELVPPSRRPAIQRLVKELLAGEPPISNQRGRR